MSINFSIYIAMAVEDRLTGFLRDARDWERKATNIPGVFLLKLPSSRTRKAVIVLDIPMNVRFVICE
jgi:hypothetical protein